MRILQIAQKPQRRGAEVFARQLGDWLAGSGHQVRHAYLYRYRGDEPLSMAPGDRALDRPEASWLEGLPSGNPALLADLGRLLRRWTPDVVQVNGGRSVKYGALLAALTPRRSWCLVYRNIDSPRFWVRGMARRVYMRHLVMPRVDGVVGVSRQTLDEVYDFYDLRVPGEFIPNGIDLGALAEPADRGRVRAEHDTGPEKVVLLFFGALTAQKRPERFIRLVADLRDAGEEVVGWLLGDGPARASLERLAAELGVTDDLRFLGYRRRVADPVAAADVFVSTSDTEGIPATVLEAGYLGLPTVGFDVGGMAECVVEGETGHLVPAGNLEALGRRVSELIRNDERRRRFGRQARDFVAGGFSMDHVGHRYESFYRRLLDAR